MQTTIWSTNYGILASGSWLGSQCSAQGVFLSILLFCPWKAGLLRQHDPEAPAAPQSLRLVLDWGRALCREKQQGGAVLTARPAPQHLHLRAGTDRAAAAVSTARVRSLVSLLHVAYSQASIRGQVDVVAIPPHGNSIPVGKNKVFLHCHPWGLKELPVLFGKRCPMKGVYFYKFSRKEGIFCTTWPYSWVVTWAWVSLHPLPSVCVGGSCVCVLCAKTLPFPLAHILEGWGAKRESNVPFPLSRLWSGCTCLAGIDSSTYCLMSIWGSEQCALSPPPLKVCFKKNSKIVSVQFLLE